jgi:hypothetical protein
MIERYLQRAEVGSSNTLLGVRSAGSFSTGIEYERCDSKEALLKPLLSRSVVVPPRHLLTKPTYTATSSFSH